MMPVTPSQGVSCPSVANVTEDSVSQEKEKGLTSPDKIVFSRKRGKRAGRKNKGLKIEEINKVIEKNRLKKIKRINKGDIMFCQLPERLQISNKSNKKSKTFEIKPPQDPQRVTEIQQLLATRLNMHINSLSDDLEKEELMKINQLLQFIDPNQQSQLLIILQLLEKIFYRRKQAELLEFVIFLKKALQTNEDRISNLDCILQAAPHQETNTVPSALENSLPLPTKGSSVEMVEQINPFLGSTETLVKALQTHVDTLEVCEQKKCLSKIVQVLQLVLQKHRDFRQTKDYIVRSVILLKKILGVTIPLTNTQKDSNLKILQLVEKIVSSPPASTCSDFTIPIGNVQNEHVKTPQEKLQVVHDGDGDASSSEGEKLATEEQEAATGSTLTSLVHSTHDLKRNDLHDSETVALMTEDPYQDLDCEMGEFRLLRQSSVFLDDKKLSIISVGKTETSFYASLAYLLSGTSCKTFSQLNTAAEKLRKETILFLRANKEVFLSNLNKLHDRLCSKDQLQPRIRFEHCLFYLNQPDYRGIQEALLIVVSMMNTPIIVWFKDGEGSLRVEPCSPSVATPINVLYCKSTNHFDPILKIVLKDQILLASPFRNKLTVVTWHVAGRRKGNLEIEEEYRIIDEILAKHNIDVACIQGVRYESNERSTDHYQWWCSVPNSIALSVVFLINKKSGITLTNFHSQLNSLISADIFIHQKCIKLIGCNFSINHKYHFKINVELTRLLKSVSELSQIILLGDICPYVGIDDLVQAKQEVVITDPFDKTFKINSIYLKKLAQDFDLHTFTTFSNEQAISSPSFRSDEELHQTSHIFIQKGILQVNQHYRWWDPISDHAIVGCTIEEICKPKVIDSNVKPSFLLVATWNVDDCSTTEKQESIDKVLKEFNIDLICVQGTNLEHNMISTSHYSWWCNDFQIPNTKSVALLLRQDCGATLYNFTSHSIYLSSAIVSIGKNNFIVVCCYLPESSEQSTYRQVSADLLLILNSAPFSAKLLLLGEFNAHVGKTDVTVPQLDILNRTGLQHELSNKNGEFLKRLALLHDLYFCSTLFRTQCENEVKDQTSHILLQQYFLKSRASSWNSPLSEHSIVGYNISLGVHSAPCAQGWRVKGLVDFLNSSSMDNNTPLESTTMTPQFL